MASAGVARRMVTGCVCGSGRLSMRARGIASTRAASGPCSVATMTSARVVNGGSGTVDRRNVWRRPAGPNRTETGRDTSTSSSYLWARPRADASSRGAAAGATCLKLQDDPVRNSFWTGVAFECTERAVESRKRAENPFAVEESGGRLQRRHQIDVDHGGDVRAGCQHGQVAQQRGQRVQMVGQGVAFARARPLALAHDVPGRVEP